MNPLMFQYFAIEMEKIADAGEQDRDRPSFKRFLKNTALVGAGTAAGHGVASLAHHLVTKSPTLRAKWARYGSPTRAKILRVATGLAGAGLALSAEHLAYQKWKARKNGN